MKLRLQRPAKLALPAQLQSLAPHSKPGAYPGGAAHPPPESGHAAHMSLAETHARRSCAHTILKFDADVAVRAQVPLAPLKQSKAASHRSPDQKAQGCHGPNCCQGSRRLLPRATCAGASYKLDTQHKQRHGWDTALLGRAQQSATRWLKASCHPACVRHVLAHDAAVEGFARHQRFSPGPGVPWFCRPRKIAWLLHIIDLQHSCA